MLNKKHTPSPGLGAPSVPSALNNGIIPIEQLTEPLLVELNVWTAARPQFTYQLLFDDMLIGPERVINDEQPGERLTLEIPIALLNEGLHDVGYRTKNPFSELADDSLTTRIQIDRTAPGNPLLAPIIFPDAIQDGLTLAELDALENKLPGKIASYSGMKEGDVIRTYWGAVEGPVAIVGGDDMGLQRVMVDFSRDFLENIGDIEALVYYTVTDLAGNLSMNSQPIQVRLQLLTLPMLPLPVVKEAIGDTLDPANTANGATVVIDASAQLRSGDRVVAQWSGPKGSDSREMVITEAQAGIAVALVFSSALVDINKGQTVSIAYTVRRANGSEQTSETLQLSILTGQTQLPAPTLDTVGPDGILTPSNIPDSGATVRVAYADMSTGDSVSVSWKGVTVYDTPAQVIGGNVELQFNVPKAFVTQSIGAPASVVYTVTRSGTLLVSAPLWLQVQQGLAFDTSPVTLDGKVYLLVGHPALLPHFPANTTVQRSASGGQAPYTYSSSDENVAYVDENGLTSVRGKGTATITATDALGESQSYPVTVTGVILCQGFGNAKLSEISAKAANAGARLPSIDELNQIFNAYGNRWPMGNGYYWSSTLAAQNLVGMKWYLIKNLVTGENQKSLEHKVSFGVGIR